MSRIDKLIKKHCPDGVEFRELGKVAEISTGSSNTQDADESGIYPFYVRSQEVKKILSYEFDEEAIIIPGEGRVGEIFHYAVGKYALHQRAYRICFKEENINTKFIFFYVMSNFKKFILNHVVTAAVKSIRKPMIEKFTIPIPPLPVQEEIVDILDSFTKLEAELEAELEARKIQYEYYRDELLNFDLQSIFHELGKVCNINSGGTPSKSINKYWNEGNIPWLKSESCNNKQIYSSSTYITNLGLQKSSAKLLDKDTTLIALVGATIFKTGFLKFQATTNQNIASIKSNNTKKLNDKFVFYFLTFLYNKLKSDMRDYSMLNLSTLKKFQIPIPPLKEQERIVAILDKFDSLLNDISMGLPAEIVARRQQYDHYRNKLLSFKEKSL